MARSNLSDRETERAALAWALMTPGWALDAGLTPDLLTVPEYQQALSALLSLSDGEGYVGTSELRAAILEAHGRVDDGVLLELTETIPTSGSAALKLLKQMAYRRGVRAQALAVLAAVEGGDHGAIAGAITDLSAGALEAPGRRTSYTPSEMMASLAEMWSEGGGLRTWPGCDALHGLIGDLIAGQECVIGAATNVGKSSLVIRMAIGMDTRGVSAGVISLEDDARLFGARIVAMECGVSSRRIIQSRIRPEEKASVLDGMRRVSQRGFSFSHLPGGTDADVVLAMTRMARAGVRVVFVDYLQAITGSGKPQDRRNEMRLANTTIKAAAQRLGIALVMTSQLRRPPDKELTRPSKHDLKEAGDVENSADVIVLMWRESEDDLAPLNCWLAKAKSGGVGNQIVYQRDRQSGSLLPVVEGDAQPPTTFGESYD